MSGSSSTGIDLSQLAAPQVVETLSYEAVLAEMARDLVAADPEFSALLESDPAVKVLEVCAARELTLRQRVNDAARSVMLAYATGGDLDNLAALYNLTRAVLIPGDASAVPPVAEVLESNESFRRRVQLAPEGMTVAGSEGAYIFHALNASADVKDCGVSMTTPGTVSVRVLSRQGSGTASTQLCADVAAYLSAAERRPLTDNVVVTSAQVTSYAITATLYAKEGPSAAVVVQAAREAAQKLADAGHAVGAGVYRSAIFAALHQPGITRVELASPAADIAPQVGRAPYCTAINLTLVAET